ncbi:MAG: ABC transporter permease [Tissierellia bacterium]|nr:ABC transporter permease [Tissierellia bacterium]
MLNILKYEVKRAYKSHSTYIILTVLLLFLTLPVIVELHLIKSAKSQGEILMVSASDPEEINIQINKSLEIAREEANKSKDDKDLQAYKEETIEKNFSLQAIYNNFSTSGPTPLFLVLFVALAAGKDYSSGYMKNLMPIKNYRIYQPLAKMALALIYTLIGLITSLISFAIMAKIISNNLTMDWAKTGKFLGTVVLGQMAISSLVILIANASQKHMATLIISLLLIMGMGNPILSLIDGLGFLPINLMQISLFNIFAGFFIGLEEALFIEKMKDIIKISCPMIMILLGLNISILRRRDINLA